MVFGNGLTESLIDMYYSWIMCRHDNLQIFGKTYFRMHDKFRYRLTIIMIYQRLVAFDKNIICVRIACIMDVSFHLADIRRIYYKHSSWSMIHYCRKSLAVDRKTWQPRTNYTRKQQSAKEGVDPIVNDHLSIGLFSLFRWFLCCGEFIIQQLILHIMVNI